MSGKISNRERNFAERNRFEEHPSRRQIRRVISVEEVLDRYRAALGVLVSNLVL
jgi:hypothetical protein